MENNIMKAFKTKFADRPQALQRSRSNPKAAASSKPGKRGDIFSRSRDPREDCGTPEMMAKHDSDTLFYICAML